MTARRHELIVGHVVERVRVERLDRCVVTRHDKAELTLRLMLYVKLRFTATVMTCIGNCSLEDNNVIRNLRNSPFNV